MNDRWVVEAHYDERRGKVEELKRLVRKEVSCSSCGDEWIRSVGWSYATKRAAHAAARRLRRRGRVSVNIIDLGVRR